MEAAEETAQGEYRLPEELQQAKRLRTAIRASLAQRRRRSANMCTSQSRRCGYDADRESVVWPRGEILTRQGVQLNRQKQYRLRVYRFRKFRDCPLRAACRHDLPGRMIEISPYHEAGVRHPGKQRRAEKRKLPKRGGRPRSRSSGWSNRRGGSDAGRCGDWRR